MMPVPSYSMLLGLIGCCLGREVSPQEIRLGFEYEADDVTSIDLETTHRLVLTNGRLKPNTEGTTPKKREFHSNPRLTLFLDRPDWREFFEAPVGIPCLGQSQDLLWIEPSSLLEVQAAPVTEGSLGRTLLPFVSPNLPGRLLRLVESYEEGSLGEGRTARHSERYTALLSSHPRLALPNLYHVGDALQGRALYLHAWAAS